ncbi:Outer membrane protein OprM [Thalassocella blandensis]|nr:Outer membrane protein OprM [Thalassocella blandensis]
MNFPLKPSRLWLAISATLLLNGCVSAPDTPETAAMLDGHHSDQQLGLSNQPAQRIQAGWWQAFGDQQLNRLVAESLANNPSLAEALTRIRSAQAGILASTAAHQPGFSLDGNANYQRLSENFTYPPAEAGFGVAGGDSVWMGKLGANMSWDLDFWGRHANQLKQAKALALAAELDHATARLSISGAIAQSYVDLYSAYAYADIAEKSQTQREKILDITKNRVKAGLDTQVELKTAEAALPQAHTARLQAELQRDIAVHNLAALSGQGAEAYRDITRPQVNIDASLPLPNALPLDLLSRRPDILAAKLRVEAANAGKASAKAAFYPDINLTAFAGFQSIGLDNLFDSGSAIYNVGPALHLPLFDAKRLKAGFFTASAELDHAIASYNDTVLKAIRDVANQLSRTASLSKQLNQAQLRLAAAEEAYRLAQSRYQAGLSSQLVVLRAEENLLSAQRDIVAITSNSLVARVTLLLTVGGSFDPQQSSSINQAVNASSGVSS